ANATLDSIVDRVENLEAGRNTPGKTISEKQATRETKALKSFMLSGNTSELNALEQKDMSIVGGASTGAAMVPTFIADEIINRAIALSPLASLVRNTGPASMNYTRILNLRGATQNWSSETGSRIVTGTPQLRECKPTVGECYSYPNVTRWLLEDSSFDVRQFLLDNVSDAFAKALEAAIMTGNATNQPTGLVNTAPTSAADSPPPPRPPPPLPSPHD